MTNTTTSTRTTSEHSSFLFAVAASFTAEPLRAPILFWGRQLGTAFDVRFAPYNQLHQTLLDPASEFGQNTHGVNVLLVRPEDLGRDSAQIADNLAHLTADIRSAAPRFHVPLLVGICPGATPAALALEGVPGVHTLHADEILRLYPVDTIYDPEGERLGRIPYTETFYSALATAVVRRAHAMGRSPFKLIALDCDNTLWQGICGEDGPENVTADPPRRILQEMMLRQRDAGMLLTMVSKNNEDDVLETFRVHPEMPLRLRDFVTWRLNWDTKAENLASISEQLSLGADSFIFIDDNPKECAELEQALPEVLTLALPPDVERIPHFLEHVWALDHGVVTEEDRKRSQYYAQAAEFGNEVRRAGSLEAFMASLRLRVSIAPLTDDKVARVSQITQRTNQFNTTTRRRSEADIRTLLANGAQVYTADVSDRFGDYGLVGVMIVQPQGGTLVLDSMLLSCRALGRGVEHKMLAALARSAGTAGVIEIPFRRSAKNAPACQFLESLSFAEREDTAAGFVLRLAVEQAARVEWQPPLDESESSPVRARKSARPGGMVDYARIANELSTVPDILRAMRSAAAPGPAAAAMTDTERTLAQIWAELLERPSVKRTDNFFDLGGHSLVAVLLLLRIRETFGVELSIDEVYSGALTLADLASLIEAAQIGGLDPEEYAKLLADIENLTDEEAREMLARESLGQI